LLRHGHRSSPSAAGSNSKHRRIINDREFALLIALKGHPADVTGREGHKAANGDTAFYDAEPPWAMLLSDIFLRLSDTTAGFNIGGGEAMTDDLPTVRKQLVIPSFGDVALLFER
jgi:hypothetical protein